MNIETMSNFFKVPKEVDTTTYKPIIKEWEIYFEEVNGWNNRDVVAKVFARFLEDFTARKLEYPENVCWEERYSAIKSSTMVTRFLLRILNRRKRLRVAIMTVFGNSSYVSQPFLAAGTTSIRVIIIPTCS